jgi:hypothetical protein
MFLKQITYSKFFSLMVIAVSLSSGIANAGWKDYVDESSSIIVKSLPKSPVKARKETLIEIFSQPKVSMFDLSTSDVNDEDLPDVAYGLAKRSKNHDDFPVKFLDVSNKYISKKGIENLLIAFQRGIKVDENNEFPDVRETVMKVSFNVTNKLHAQWCEIAPSVFSGGLTILE